MTGPGDWVLPSQNVSAPPFLSPDGSGIVLGPEPPPCMAATYSAVLRFQPLGSSGAGLDSNPQWYIGQRANNVAVDFGWCIFDQTGTVCGFRVVWAWQGTNRLDGLGTITDVLNMGGINVANTLPAFFSSVLNIGQTSGNVLAPVYALNINFGDPLVSTTPNPAKTPLTVDQRSLPRGIIDSTFNAAAIGPIGVGADTIFATGTTRNYWDQRVYEVRYKLSNFGSVQNSAIITCHQNNAAGTTYDADIKMNPAGTTQQTHHGRFLLRNVSGATINMAIALGFSASVGTVSTLGQSGFEVYDVGAVANHSAAIPNM